MIGDSLLYSNENVLIISPEVRHKSKNQVSKRTFGHQMESK